MTQLKTPGVYIKRIERTGDELFDVPSAIPLFIGYTVKAENEKGESLTRQPTRVRSLEDFTERFGEQHPVRPITLSSLGNANVQVQLPDVRMYLFLSMKLYFGNGGGDSFVLSADTISEVDSMPTRTKVKADLLKALESIRSMDEPTLIIIPDAVNLDSRDAGEVYQEALAGCAKIKGNRQIISRNRFVIMDLPKGYLDQKATQQDEGEDPVDVFRKAIGFSNLQFGAAYYPWVYIDQDFPFRIEDLEYSTEVDQKNAPGDMSGTERARSPHSDQRAEHKPALEDVIEKLPSSPEEKRLLKSYRKARDWVMSLKRDQKDVNRSLPSMDSVPGPSGQDPNPETYKAERACQQAEEELLDKHAVLSSVREQVLLELKKVPVTGALAGIYVVTDRERGVWKAPANVSLQGVLGPVIMVDDHQQEELNMPLNGKSINAIRTKIGRGTVVWGARTLAGSDLNWRYIPVRRLFSYVEASLRQQLEPFLFDSNQLGNWIEMRFIAENFLTSLWRKGAFAGSTPNEAFFVRVGLGETMIQQDILEGRVIMEIGLAAVRPLEFITIILPLN